MKSAAASQGLPIPWDNYKNEKEEWDEWWRGREKAKGQTPSLMFLWYLVCLERNKINNILVIPGGTAHLKIVFRGTTEEALDIYCAQLQYQEQEQGTTTPGLNLVSNLDTISNEYFPKFAQWMYRILSRGLSGISVDTYKQLALFIAGAVEIKALPENLSDSQWNSFGKFIRRPRQASRDLFGSSDAYPEPKGRWTGQRGQKQQCDKAVEIVKKILEQ